MAHQNTKSRIYRCSFVIIAAVVMLFTLCPVIASSADESADAIDITNRCRFKPSSNEKTFRNAIDGIPETIWTSGGSESSYIDISIASSDLLGGIYFRWDQPPESWKLFAVQSNGNRLPVLTGGSEGYLTQYVMIPSAFAGYKTFRLVMNASTTKDVDITEISFYSPGIPPYYAPMWQPLQGRADLLTIVSHPDDEDLYMGAPAPAYADKGMKCETVYMTYGSSSHSVRRFEAQESAWSLGNKSYPVMGNFVDKKTFSKEEMEEYWPLDETVGFLVEQIRRFKPSVIVTHDVKGEYGHGAHRLTEYATTLAFQYAADPTKYPESAEKYGTWAAGKLYVHLYRKDALHLMSMTKKLKSFNNRTELLVIRDAYSRQKSQLPGRVLPTSGPYDMRRFGLFATRLGPDKMHASMFENVTDSAMQNLNPGYKPMQSEQNSS